MENTLSDRVYSSVLDDLLKFQGRATDTPIPDTKGVQNEAKVDRPNQLNYR